MGVTVTQIGFDFTAYAKLPAPLAWERPSRPLPPNPYRTNSQRYRIYDRLARYGRVKNIEIMFGLGGPRIMNGTGRTSEIREFLKPYGFKLHCYPINNDGVYIYEVRP